MGGTAEWWSALSPHSEKALRSEPPAVLPVRRLLVLPVSAWVLPGFPPQSKDSLWGLGSFGTLNRLQVPGCECEWWFVSGVSPAKTQWTQSLSPDVDWD